MGSRASHYGRDLGGDPLARFSPPTQCTARPYRSALRRHSRGLGERRMGTCRSFHLRVGLPQLYAARLLIKASLDVRRLSVWQLGQLVWSIQKFSRQSVRRSVRILVPVSGIQLDSNNPPRRIMLNTAFPSSNIIKFPPPPSSGPVAVCGVPVSELSAVQRIQISETCLVTEGE
ncbi:hypothetical protein EDB92DRAFT_1835309 [Lactarius akahatsu]|uniref:Uncharacterized protein n=1 Tax=Lactarius akahatsu TaxID=416441 RepID=A0AAD4LNK2_9AGAM|nr:hypothetical protein EDB92DRAFT_1835309 [Lactarius akahatsu]